MPGILQRWRSLFGASGNQRSSTSTSNSEQTDIKQSSPAVGCSQKQELPDIEDLLLGFNEVTPRRKEPFHAELYQRSQDNRLLVLSDACKNSEFHKSADILPDDVLGVVFSFVGVRTLCVGCMRSCKRWFVASMESNLWTSMFLSDFGDDAEGHNLKLVKNFKKRHFYLIYKRTSKRSTGWNSPPETLPVGSLLKWRYRCPLSWFDLDPISATERHCSACGKNVQKFTVPELQEMVETPSCALVVAAGADVGSLDADTDYWSEFMGEIAAL